MTGVSPSPISSSDSCGGEEEVSPIPPQYRPPPPDPPGTITALYRQVKRNVHFRKRAFQLLQAAASYVKTDFPPYKPFREYDWNLMVYNYYADALNFPDEIGGEVLGTMLAKIRSYTDLPVEQSLQILQQVNQELDAQMPHWQIGQCKVGRAPDKKTFMMWIGDLTISIPCRVARQILAKCTDHRTLIKLVLRYELIGRSSSIFWSIDVSLYDRFVHLDQVTRPLPTLECFASPFNRHLESYCSIFEQDEPYGSLGSFFTFIKKLEQPGRFIFNPPYTVKVINEGAYALTQHMLNYPESEFIALLPSWTALQGTVLLSSLANSYQITLEGGSYILYDYAQDGAIIGTRSSILVVNIGQSRDLSMRYANLAKKNLEEKARALRDKQYHARF